MLKDCIKNTKNPCKSIVKETKLLYDGICRNYSNRSITYNMEYQNDYMSMLLVRARQQELMEKAEKHRLATVQNEVARRVRQAENLENKNKS